MYLRWNGWIVSFFFFFFYRCTLDTIEICELLKIIYKLLNCLNEKRNSGSLSSIRRDYCSNDGRDFTNGLNDVFNILLPSSSANWHFFFFTLANNGKYENFISFYQKHRIRSYRLKILDHEKINRNHHKLLSVITIGVHECISTEVTWNGEFVYFFQF